MIVAASTDCFPDLSLDEALHRMVDLEYTAVELALREDGRHLRPSAVHADVEEAVRTCGRLLRLIPVAITVDMVGTSEQDYATFASICQLAKTMKVFSITVPSSELGTPFNAEVERLRELVRIAAAQSLLVSIKTEVDRMSQDPDTVTVLCDNVKGLGVTLDPSHFVVGPAGRSYDKLLGYVYHVQLRDSTENELLVRIGQGDIEYGRLIGQLDRAGYDRALAVDIQPLEDVDHAAEMRKMRLLLESLL
ncbi:MAG: TIM barrel protein [Pirellulales bacterium]|nr:sugar phosphate isomerase/epimerase [Planctomycetales bacterium]